MTQPTTKSSRYRGQFPQAIRQTYLDTAAEGLPVPGMEAALCEYVREKTRGTPGRDAFFAKEEETRRLAAQLLGTSSANVAFTPTASDAINLLAASLPFEPGDEIITTDLEFPSNVLPWLALERRKVSTIVVRSTNGALQLSDLTNAITQRTRLVTVSLVSYKTGAYFPHISELADAAHAVGAVLCVDATQALGRCPVPLDNVDYLMASSFKWLLGPHGLAITYLSPEFRSRFDLLGVGWYSVDDAFSTDRFERYRLKQSAACISAGMPNFASLYGLYESLRFLLNIDLPQEQARLNQLSVQLQRNLKAQRLNLLTPADRAFISGIVSFEHPQAEQIGRLLKEKSIIVWAGDGRVRASLHLYNDESDVRRCTEALHQILKLVTNAG